MNELVGRVVPVVAARRVEVGGERFYAIDGRLYPSVTTVLSVVGKPALVRWAKKVALEYVREAVRGSAVIQREALEAVLERAMGEPERVRDAAAERGSAAHEGIAERLVRGVGDERALLRELGLAVLTTECVVYSVSRGFAGTADVVAVDRDGRLVTVDWKTGGVWPEHALQVGAYRLALAEMTGRPVGDGYVVGLKGGKPVVYRVDTGLAARGFLAALELYRVLRDEGLLLAERR